MRRGWLVLGTTVLGLGGLLAFDQHEFGDPFALSSATAGLKLPAQLAAGAGTSGAGAAAADTAAQTQATTQPQEPAATTQAQRTQPAAAKIQNAVGDSVANPYGNVQVKVRVKGGRLVRVTFLDLPYGDPTSQAISNQVAPVLAQQAIDGQTAQVAGIAGASYTSEAYRQSLQSALDKTSFGS